MLRTLINSNTEVFQPQLLQTCYGGYLQQILQFQKLIGAPDQLMNEKNILNPIDVFIKCLMNFRWHQ